MSEEDYVKEFSEKFQRCMEQYRKGLESFSKSIENFVEHWNQLIKELEK